MMMEDLQWSKKTDDRGSGMVSCQYTKYSHVFLNHQSLMLMPLSESITASFLVYGDCPNHYEYATWFDVLTAPSAVQLRVETVVQTTVDF